jgi:hypothetical protein
MSILYEKTMKKEASLREMGYNVTSIWSCEFIEPKDMELNDIIKCNNKYRVISSGQFCFRDISAFLEPGSSLDKFLQAFDTEMVKGVFPHKVTQNIGEYIKQHPYLSGYSNNIIELLKHSSIPSKEWFYNDLKGESIPQEQYDDFRLKFKNLYDLLGFYNNCDVGPAVQATRKLAGFFKSLDLDIHKDGISISGLTLKYLWTTKEPSSCKCSALSRAPNLIEIITKRTKRKRGNVIESITLQILTWKKKG